jgi:hypothetical protein
MDVHIQSREGAEQLGSAALLAAFNDLMVSEYTLEPGTEPASRPTPSFRRRTTSTRSEAHEPWRSVR